ncbi:Uncharacterized protein BP5553_01154 [Venustampulla echinocandica]|uniref:dolichol kinase n=1 Tax=Venustampulla echinocandica TaxID=2656787 RepID=A0A370U081_9HELO|nr:Uncharacterized protein BP5553_01154 [Venustampulla echinocandica]RDL41175.1 Uncharacterized protein BP5553_01154 [Venustampulla echinocandica]
MVEHLVPPLEQQSQAQNLREDALRRLSRSPHPYHRQRFELLHASERLETDAPHGLSPSSSNRNTDDEGQQGARFSPERYRESTNSDSGTEADDEHFLKGLPAPKLRARKGLRGADVNLSRSPSPLPSPAIQSIDSTKKLQGYLRSLDRPASGLKEDAVRRVADKLRQKRRDEIARRLLEAALLGGIAGIICLNPEARQLIWLWRRARVPKWRFRRPKISSLSKKSGLFGKLGGTYFVPNGALSDSSDEDTIGRWATRSFSSKLQLKTQISPANEEACENWSISAIEPKMEHKSRNSFACAEPNTTFNVQRRHTMSAVADTPIKSNKMTRSGRRKRTASSSIQSFFSLTQTQATARKWLYAGWVYTCILVIILGPVREYVGIFALYGNEPVGWALGYLFGDLPWFRMEVVKANLQRWICLPPRSGDENQESCHLGWVEHLRHASFGEANTRLILCAYWLAIIVVGLAIVFRLSTIYEVDTRRKVFHFMMVAMLLPATYVDPTFASLALGLMLATFLLLDLFRASQLPPLSKSLAYFLTPYVDGRDLKGPVVISHIFLLIGCAIPLWLSLGTLPRTGKGYLLGWEVATREVSMVSGVICVGLGDAAASLIGRRFGRHKWIWGGGKSIEGSVAFASAVSMALVLAKAWLRIGGWPGNNDNTWALTVGKAGVAATVASLTEAVLTGGNDNVVVPIVLWLCVKGLDI